MMNVRQATTEDAGQIVEVMKNAEESGLMLFNPGERNVTATQFEKVVEAINNKNNSAVFVAVEQDRIYGYIIVQGDTPNRIAHRAYIVIGVHSESRGKGVGTALFLHVEEWAREVGLQRLELTVITYNDAAYHLYKKMGFEMEGVKRSSLCIDGRYVDEYYMAKLI
ncbi:GNAT family N-acetyltransferase [Lysinibacillus sp. LZ02]|uniref:GNAT family N-acetyltransferase n=1 Tax=Lysinibacillus sp. LZ02 TaxID=3420668 RepID=UPI003D35F217